MTDLFHMFTAWPSCFHLIPSLDCSAAEPILAKVNALSVGGCFWDVQLCYSRSMRLPVPDPTSEERDAERDQHPNERPSPVDSADRAALPCSTSDRGRRIRSRVMAACREWSPEHDWKEALPELGGLSSQ